MIWGNGQVDCGSRGWQGGFNLDGTMGLFANRFVVPWHPVPATRWTLMGHDGPSRQAGPAAVLASKDGHLSAKRALRPGEGGPTKDKDFSPSFSCL